MSTVPGTPASPPRPARRRRRLLGAAVAALLAVLVVLGVVVLGNDEEVTRTPAAATATPTEAPAATTAPAVVPQLPTPEPTGPTEDVDEPPPSLPEVPLDAEAAVGDGVVVTLPAIEAIEGTGVGPGNIAGPALRVTVRIENGTAEPVALGGVAVNLAHGPDRTPASPLDDPSRRPFATMVEPGQSAEGVYVFTVPADARDQVHVEVGYEAGAPLLQFTGPVA
jgi:hypothetical protein